MTLTPEARGRLAALAADWRVLRGSPCPDADELTAALSDLSALEGEVGRLRKALEARDRYVAGCPVNKTTARAWPADCPECGATSSDCCWWAVRADATFVDAARTAINLQVGHD